MGEDDPLANLVYGVQQPSFVVIYHTMQHPSQETDVDPTEDPLIDLPLYRRKYNPHYMVNQQPDPTTNNTENTSVCLLLIY